MGAGELANQLAGLDDLLRIEAGGRLVEHEHFGLVNQRLCQSDALPVALRELAAVAVRHVSDPGFLHHGVDAIVDVGAHALDLRDEPQVIAHGHVGIEGRGLREISGPALGFERMIEDVVAGDRGLALSGRHVAGDDPHGGGLAGAVWAQEPENLARIRPKTDVIDGRKWAVFLGKVLNLDHEGSPEK